MPASRVPVAAGIGLRFPHHQRFLEERPRIPWLEVHAENYLGGGTVRRCLDELRGEYPVSLHGVGLSLGSAEGVDRDHLERIATLVEELQPQLVSEHLSWSTVDGRYLADLLPLPLTEETLQVVCRNLARVQARLKRRVLIENPSTYLSFDHATIPEWEFLEELVQRTGCGLLCDVNNVFVSASNHGWNPAGYLRGLPAEAVEEIHLAGHATRVLEDGRALRIDDHGSRVAPEVWDLYVEALRLFGSRPTLIEWDTNIPALEVLLDEAAHAQRLIEEIASTPRRAMAGESRGGRSVEHLPSERAPLPVDCRSTPQPPALATVQQAVRAHLFACEPAAPVTPVPGLSAQMLSRLPIYRNTCRSVLVHALELSFPAVRRLVGKDFFAGAAERFIDDAPGGVPRSAWLNDYGAAFPAFLASFAPAAQIPYLADVARLEWAVNGALHAPDAAPLDAARLATLLGPGDERLPRSDEARSDEPHTDEPHTDEPRTDELGNDPTCSDLRLVPHPALTLLSLGFPADAIWQAVLEEDDARLATLDLADGPVWLLIERNASGVQVQRLTESAWHLTARLCAGEPLKATLAEHAQHAELRERAALLLAEHLSGGRFKEAVRLDAFVAKEGGR